MALELVQELDVTTEFVRIKFGVTPRASSIVNAVFKVYINTATPSSVSNPFQTIDLAQHYNSISKLLMLYWNSGKLVSSTAYKIVVSGLKDGSGAVIPDATYYFTTGSNVGMDSQYLPPAATPVQIEDHSIRSTAFTDVTTIIEANPDFYIVSVDPNNQDFDLPVDYNNGRIAIKFSTLPNGVFLNSTYFKVQKKLIQRAPSRWLTITPRVTGDSGSNIVYLELPSTDATPVYGTASKTYFEAQYKYRIVISKDVGV